MAFITEDAVWETTASTGTGNLALAGAVSGYVALSSVCANGDTFLYTVRHQAASEFETGVGTYVSSGNQFSRSPIRSSNSNALVSFSAGTKDVVIAPLASNSPIIRPDNAIFIPAATSPATPPSGFGSFYAKSRGGRVLPFWMGPSGLDTPLQPGFSGNSVSMWLPGTGTTLGINFGVSFTARNSGTSAAQATPAIASTNALTSMKRATFGTGTTATGASGVQSSATVCWRGNAAGLGGFFFGARFGIETLASDMRAFVGLSANNAAMAADASTWNNTCGICKDTGDSTWQVLTRNGTTATKTNSTCTVTAGQVLDLYMFAPPNGSNITFRLVDPVTGTVYVNESVVSATLPVNTTFLFMQAHAASVTGLTAKLLALNKMYLETDL